jgi:Zn-dependent alcohol dehydrogenase
MRDFALDTSGQPSVITQAFNALRPGGTLALIGGPATPEFAFDAYRFLGGRGVRGLTEGEAGADRFKLSIFDTAPGLGQLEVLGGEVLPELRSWRRGG